MCQRIVRYFKNRKNDFLNISITATILLQSATAHARYSFTGVARKKTCLFVLGPPVAMMLMSVGLSRAVTTGGTGHLTQGVARGLYGQPRESVERQYGRPVFVGRHPKNALCTYVKGHARISVIYDKRGNADWVMAADLEREPGEGYIQYYPAQWRKAYATAPDALSAYNQ